MKVTIKETKRRLAEVEAIYRRCLSEIAALPNGNGFATQKEMREETSAVYGPTIAALQRRIEGR